MKNDLTKSELIKRYLSKKMILGITSLFMGLAIIFVCSIIPFGFNPQNWNSTEFISDEVILVALTIMGEVCLLIVGQSYNQANPMSKISRATSEFDKSVDENINGEITKFDQWIKNVLQPHDQSEKHERLLLSAGIENKNYLKLENSELKKCLLAPQKIDNVYYRQLTKQQYKLISDIQNGKYTISFVSPDTYRKLSKFDNDRTISEKMSNQSKKKNAKLLSSVFTKTLMVVSIGLIFGALIPLDNESGYQTSTILMKLFSRLFNFASAGFYGFLVGQQINDIDAEYIVDKIDVQKRYKSDTTFVALSEQEVARQEYIESVKKDNRVYMLEMNKEQDKDERV